MTKKKKITILVIVMFLGLAVGCLFYWANHTGSRSGRVIDAVTAQPIEGAVVTFVWKIGGFLGVTRGSIGAFCETTADKDGHYFIPSLPIESNPAIEWGVYESVVIYKDNYAVYDVSGEHSPATGRSFGYHPYQGQPYRKKDNLVKLYPWKSGESHYKHMDWVMGTTVYHMSKLLRKELEEEKKRADAERILGKGNNYNMERALR